MSQPLELLTQVVTCEVATHLSSRSFDGNEWRDAERLGRAIVKAVERRAAIVEEEALDPLFSLPAANWDAATRNQMYPAYQLISQLRPEDVRVLRVRAQAFSGYSLFYMDFNQGRSSVAPITAEITSRIRQELSVTLIEHWHLLTANVPRRFWDDRPHALGEAGWWLNGILLNQDTISYQERLTLAHHAGIFERLSRLARPPRILEIGGGYGALAHDLTSAFPECEYIICDIPELLLFSGLYLRLASKKSVALGLTQAPGICLLPNYRFGQLLGHRFDLVINTLSLSEMTEHQAAAYARGIRDLIGADGIFFEQNQDNRHVGFIYCKDMLASVFRARQSLKLTNVPMTQGEADIWTN